MLLAMDSGMTTGKMPRHRNPRAGLRHAGRLDRAGQRDQAEMFGYTVVEPDSVLATHLTEIVRSTPTKSSPATPPST